MSLQVLSLCMSLSTETSHLYFLMLEGSAALPHFLSKAESCCVFTCLVFLQSSFSQLIKVCLRTPLLSSEALRPPGQARPQPDVPQHRLILTWDPAPSTLRPPEANRGLKMPLIWAKLSVQRLVQQHCAGTDDMCALNSIIVLLYYCCISGANLFFLSSLFPHFFCFLVVFVVNWYFISKI